MKLDNPLRSFEKTNNRPAIQPRAASNGTTHMPTEPPSNENQLPEADKGTLNDKLSKFKKERQLIDEQLGKQDADLASRLRTMHTFPFIEDICAVFRQLALRQLALDSGRITAEERDLIKAVDKRAQRGSGRFDTTGSGFPRQSHDTLSDLLNSCTLDASVKRCGQFSISIGKNGEIPLHERIKFSVEVGWASQGRKTPFPKIPITEIEKAVRIRNHIFHSVPLQQEAPDYAAVEGLLCWFLAQLYAMLGCPESRAFDAYYKRVSIPGGVVAVVDGGLLVNIGVEAFVPLEELGSHPPNDLSPFVGNKYIFQVVRPNDERGRVILSRRAIIELERSERWNAFMESKKHGDPVKLVVRSIVQSGARVDIEGMECPLLISQISKGPVENLHVDQEIEASVMKVDRRRRQIDISTKAADYSVLDEEAARRKEMDKMFRVPPVQKRE